MSTIVDFLNGTKVLAEVESPLNGTLTVVKDYAWGTYIKGGGLTQSGGVAKKVWKTSLNEVKKSKNSINSCLILGLGGGSIAQLVSRNWPNAKIIGVDLDKVIVDLGKKYLRLPDKVTIKIVDGFKYSENTKKKFDLICVDTYIQDNYPEQFETQKFLNNLKKILNTDGVVVFNRLYYGEKRKEAEKFAKKLERHFAGVERVYPEANIMFIAKINA